MAPSTGFNFSAVSGKSSKPPRPDRPKCATCPPLWAATQASTSHQPKIPTRLPALHQSEGYRSLNSIFPRSRFAPHLLRWTGRLCPALGCSWEFFVGTPQTYTGTPGLSQDLLKLATPSLHRPGAQNLACQMWRRQRSPDPSMFLERPFRGFGFLTAFHIPSPNWGCSASWPTTPSG